MAGILDINFDVTFTETLTEGDASFETTVTWDRLGYNANDIVDWDLQIDSISGDATQGSDYIYDYELTDSGLTVTFTALEDNPNDAENDETAVFNLSGFVCYDWPFGAQPDEQVTYIDQGFVTLEFDITNVARSPIAGGEGEDNLGGTVYGDLICGFGGDDVIHGRKGNDEIKGGSGDDVIYGNGGHDSLFGGNGDDVIRGGSGQDLIKGGKGADVLVGGTGRDVLIGGRGMDVLRGGGGADDLRGGGRADVLKGNGGADHLTGGKGADVLVGGNGSDTLDGGTGRDVLTGGKGADVLTGGRGADVFVFSAVNHSPAGGRHDTITDFNARQGDVIDLSRIDAQSGRGNQAFDFIGTDDFTGTKGELRVYSVGEDLHVAADTDGDGQADFELVVTGASDLSQSDFVV